MRFRFGFCWLVIALFIALFLAQPAQAELDYELSGNIEGELRFFPSDEPGLKEFNASLRIDPILEMFFGRDHSLTVNPYFRADQNDGRRTHFDLRQFKWIGIFGDWEIRLGVDKVFWGVTESVHLVDVINQDDAVEDIDGEDKLGQPMASVSYWSDIGTFTLYVMPYFRERTFAGRDGRPQGPLLIDTRNPIYESGSNQWHLDWALRYKRFFGAFDVGLSYFRGINRDPDFLPGLGEGGEPVLRPFYDTIDQVGLDVQATFGAWLLKFEGITRKGDVEDRFWSFAAGVEYTFFQVFGSDADIGVLAEYLYDDRDEAAPVPTESDLFFGLRWEGNDVETTRILGGMIFDLDSQAKFGFVEASRRLGSRWRVSIEARFFMDVLVQDPLYFFRRDDFVQFRLARFF